MTEAQLRSLNELFCSMNEAREFAIACETWAAENISDGYYKLKIEKKYFDSRQFMGLEEKYLKIPAKVITKQINALKAEAASLQKKFDNISSMDY